MKDGSFSISLPPRRTEARLLANFAQPDSERNEMILEPWTWLVSSSVKPHGLQSNAVK